MSSPSPSIHSRLSDDAELVGLLATYRDVPAVLVADYDDLPEDVEAPYIVIHGRLSDDPDDCKDADGRDQLISVRCYAPSTGSSLLIDQIAERARTLLHRDPDDLVPGAWMVSVAGPSIADTDRSLVGRQLDVRIRSLVTS